MNDWAVVRILGNELPPRDLPGSRIKVLRYMLEHEAALENADKLWLINRVTDVDLYHQYRELLLQYFPASHVHALHFDPGEYVQAKTFDEKIQAIINVNQARNEAIAWAHRAGYTWALILDGDCYWEQEAWAELQRGVTEDSQAPNQRYYYSVPSRRARLDDAGELTMLGDYSDCMPAFHQDSCIRFDETIPFGQSDKQMLLRRLGHTVLGYDNQSKLIDDSVSRCLSYVVHIGTGDRETETNLNVRMRRRHESLKRLVADLDKCINMPPEPVVSQRRA